MSDVACLLSRKVLFTKPRCRKGLREHAGVVTARDQKCWHHQGNNLSGLTLLKTKLTAKL